MKFKIANKFRYSSPEEFCAWLGQFKEPLPIPVLILKSQEDWAKLKLLLCHGMIVNK